MVTHKLEPASGLQLLQEAIPMVLEKKGITPLLGYPGCQILSKRVIAVF